MSEVVTCYRFVTEDLRSQNGDEQWVVGEWKRVTGELSVCNIGLHGCREPTQSLGYVFGDRWFLSEARGEIVEAGDKFCAREMRLVKEIPVKVVHQWMVDCAYRVLRLFEEKYPDDQRPRLALVAKQGWIDNPCEETGAARAAARDAAWAAVGAAARAAVGAAAWAAAWAAWAAAWAAGDAAWAAAWAAARAAARAAEEKWQEQCLQKLIKEALSGE